MEGYKERLEALIQSKEALYRDMLSQENADVFESAKDLLVQGLSTDNGSFFAVTEDPLPRRNILLQSPVAVFTWIVHRLPRFVWEAVGQCFPPFPMILGMKKLLQEKYKP